MAVAIASLIALIAVVLATVLLGVNSRLRRALRERDDLIEGLDKPVLWLPQKDREAHARKLLQREDDEYQQRLIDQFMSGNKPVITPPEGI